MVTPIEEIIVGLQAAGIFNFYLPFFILFAIFYALLTKSGIFGDPKEPLPRKINLIVALGASAYVLIYTPIGGTVLTLGEYLATLFSQTFIIIMTFLAVLIIGYVLLVPLGVEPRKRGPTFAKYIVGVLIILGTGLFISSGGLTFFIKEWPTLPTIIFPPLTLEDIAILSVIVFTGIVIWWITQPTLKPKEREELEAYRRAAEEARRRAAAEG